jgi:hypothetical protein
VRRRATFRPIDVSFRRWAPSMTGSCARSRLGLMGNYRRPVAPATDDADDSREPAVLRHQAAAKRFDERPGDVPGRGVST